MAVRRSFAPLGGAHKLLISSRKTIIVTSVDPKHHGVSGRCHRVYVSKPEQHQFRLRLHHFCYSKINR